MRGHIRSFLEIPNSVGSALCLLSSYKDMEYLSERLFYTFLSIFVSRIYLWGARIRILYVFSSSACNRNYCQMQYVFISYIMCAYLKKRIFLILPRDFVKILSIKEPICSILTRPTNARARNLLGGSKFSFLIKGAFYSCHRPPRPPQKLRYVISYFMKNVIRAKRFAGSFGGRPNCSSILDNYLIHTKYCIY